MICLCLSTFFIALSLFIADVLRLQLSLYAAIGLLDKIVSTHTIAWKLWVLSLYKYQVHLLIPEGDGWNVILVWVHHLRLRGHLRFQEEGFVVVVVQGTFKSQIYSVCFHLLKYDFMGNSLIPPSFLYYSATRKEMMFIF